MTEVAHGILQERRGEGQKFYKEGMQLSGPDKAKILPYVRPGTIVEGGPGTGVVTDLMKDKFPESTIFAVDISDDMINELHKKYNGAPKIHVVKHDIVDYDPGIQVDTYVHVSNIHEVFSEGGYAAVNAMLKNEFAHTKPGGRLVIRDGVQPRHEPSLVKPKTDFAVDRFFRFVKGFKVEGDVPYEIGDIDPETLVWHPHSDAKVEPGNFFVKMPSHFSSELFSKYFYPEMNLPVEFSEQFGILTLEGYQDILRKAGYKIFHAETYLLPYLLENKYSVDFDYFLFDKNGVPRNAPYPDSTTILVGEK